MAPWAAVVVWLLAESAWCASHLKFPSGFKFGAATSAYQVEGAWNTSGKTPSTWDTLTHNRPQLITDGSSGDVACDSYHQWKDDIQIASELGLDFYRFSISWPRLMPTSFPDEINEDGRRYYDNLINGLLDKGIEPIITMYHWDLPQRLQDHGGWSNPLIVEWFEEYARVLYKLFGDRVKNWVTINEPFTICTIGYAIGAFSSGVHDPEVGTYLCIKNVVMAHAKAWRLYDKEYRKQFKGRVGISHQLFYLHPTSEEDEEIASLAHEHYVRAYDFYGFNYYTSRKIRRRRDGESLGQLSPMRNIKELDAILEVDRGWDRAACFWFYVYPEGIRKLLSWVKNQYGDVEIVITENGYSTKPESGSNDYDRIKYYRDHLEQVLLAIHEDKVNITGYTAWSLIDNFEWNDGYTTKFGLYEVNFDDPNRQRTPRASAKYYKNVIQTNNIEIPKKFSTITDEL
ncbi:jg15733 [Pararge aegeria aegeria]|uniref:Jg15733 protein n=1 Tax=Pararge aegeria aegeria TaxID=348720 RepID=A0A8S4SM92_9NEOP|nr:jg15733 [Pararge aegeria aegeria]